MRRLLIVALLCVFGGIVFFLFNQNTLNADSDNAVDCSKAFCEDPVILEEIEILAKKNNIIELANKELYFLINNIPEVRLEEYGFTQKPDVKDFKILPPIPEIIGAGTIEETLKKPFNVWIVPLSLEGRIILVMTIIEENGDFRVSSFGGSGLAKRLDAGFDFIGYPPQQDAFWLRVKYVTFITPAIDMLIFYKQDSGFNWLILSGEGAPKLLDSKFDSEEIDTMMESIRIGREQWKRTMRDMR